jgi:type VI secretion system secreted protein VgrG
MAADNRIEASLTLHDYTGRSRVEAISGWEEVSRGFEYTIDVQAEALELDELRGSFACVSLSGPGGQSRALCGMLAAIEVLGLQADRTLDLDSYRLVLKPVTHVLTLRHGFRIFQERNTMQIIERVLVDAGIPESAFSLPPSGPMRAYCVQYDESEWDFVCRLLEEDGYHFRFDHSEAGHVFVVVESSKNAPAMDPDYLPFEHVGGLEARLCARELDVKARAHENRAALSDLHPLRPSTKLLVELSDKGPFDRELYEYPSRCVDPARQKKLARMRLDERIGAASGTRVRTNVVSAAAGHKLTLDGHPTSAQGEHFVRAVSWSITLRALPTESATGNAVGKEARGQKSERGATCDVDLDLQPFARPFHPARVTKRPRVIGLQTARITGPSGQEVFFDDHGRVKVQFHWDREGKLNEHSSCFLPVVQGHTTGSMAMPRIGWEVLVEFVDGDPDRPICQGRLYNPFFPPPASLPGEKTVSVMRSESVGGTGFNQLRIDDQAGAESFALHAQYDLNTAVAHNKRVQVVNAATFGVGIDRVEQIALNDTESFEANFTQSITSAQTVDIGAKRSLKVNGNATEETTADFTRTIAAAESIQVGSLATALIQLLASEAISGAVGAAAKAAERMGARALGPLVPALTAAREAVGGAARYAGAAAALLGGGHPGATALGEFAGALASVDESTSLDTATGMAAAAASAEFAPKITAAVTSAAAVGGGGAGGAGGGGAGGAEAGDAGSGNFTTHVNGNVTETVGGLVAWTSAHGITHGVGGNRSEIIGAARIEAIKGGRNETTGAAKAENVGTYTVKAKESITFSSGAAASIEISGAFSQNIGGSHTLTAGKDVQIKTSKLKLKAKGSIALVCGMAKVVVSKSGVTFFGLQKVSIEGNKITLDPVDIGPG